MAKRLAPKILKAIQEEEKQKEELKLRAVK